MDTFRGFDRDTFFLLAENKFNDSKPYYETVKDQLKQKAILPMRELCSLLADELFAIDEQMNLIPVKMVSRIRRDTRRAKDQNMYRDNIWTMFMRHKSAWHYQPCMWFEIFPGGYTIGVGTYDTDPTFMAYFRRVLVENQTEFRAALQSVQSVGALPDAEHYAKEKPGSDKVAADLRPYYNVKSLYFIRYDSEMETLFNGSIYPILQKTIAAYAPMYHFLLKVMETVTAEKGKQYEQIL